jgi:hypothetical protein
MYWIWCDYGCQWRMKRGWKHFAIVSHLLLLVCPRTPSVLQLRLQLGRRLQRGRTNVVVVRGSGL